MSATLGFVATLAEMEQFYRGDKAGQIIELMNKTNDIMDDVPWMEANQSDGHLTRIRTGLPAVYWRRLYQGTPPAKSQWSQVKEGCGILEAIMELDVEEIRLYGDRDRSFRMSEGIAFAEAMRQPEGHHRCRNVESIAKRMIKYLLFARSHEIWQREIL